MSRPWRGFRCIFFFRLVCGGALGLGWSRVGFPAVARGATLGRRRFSGSLARAGRVAHLRDGVVGCLPTQGALGFCFFFSRQRRVSCLRPSSPRSLGADHGPPGESDLAPFDTEGLCFPSKSGPTVMRSLSGQGLGNTTHCAIIPGRRCVDSLLCFHLSLRPLSHGPRCHHHTDILSRRRKYTSTSAPLLWCCSATK